MPNAQAQLNAMYESGRAAHPQVLVDRRRFADYLAAFAASSPEARAPDLFLAHACCEKDPIALRELDATVLSPLRDLLAKSHGRDPADEAIQRTREVLLLPAGDGPPKLSEFSGRGPLRAWVRVVALRILHDLAARNRPMPLEELGEDHLRLDHDDVDVALIKRRYRKKFEAALSGALAELPRRERVALRMSLLDGASIDRIGAIFHVHRSTVSRWLTGARTFLLEETKRRLAVSLDGSLDLRSLAALVQSQLEVSLDRHLRAR